MTEETTKLSIKQGIRESLLEKRISLLDLGLIFAFLTLISTIAAILLGVFT